MRRKLMSALLVFFLGMIGIAALAQLDLPGWEISLALLTVVSASVLTGIVTRRSHRPPVS